MKEGQGRPRVAYSLRAREMKAAPKARGGRVMGDTVPRDLRTWGDELGIFARRWWWTLAVIALMTWLPPVRAGGRRIAGRYPANESRRTGRNHDRM